MAKKQKEAEPDRLNMTPMIDVVFQLIVFFLVSMKFKTLDMKIEAFLPKDRGLANAPAKLEDVPKLVAILKRGKGEPVTRVKVANVEIGRISDAPEAAAETERTLAVLSKMATDARARAGDAADKVKGEVDAAALVPSGDVIKAVDAFIAGNLHDVTFVGTPPPDSTLDKLMRGAQK
jgi:biopolymer transport protein ExbD